MRIGEGVFVAAAPYFFGLEGHERVTAPPRQLFELAQAGKLDAVALPVLFGRALDETFEPVLTPDGHHLGMGALGPMRSQLCFARAPMDRWGDAPVAAANLDATTPLRLLEWIARRRGARPRFVAAAAEPPDTVGWAASGDTALKERARRGGEPGIQVYDLAEEWRVETGLPFVFFRWVVRRALPERERLDLGRDLARSLDGAHARLADVVLPFSQKLALPGEVLLDYVKGLRYRLGAQDVESLHRFLRLEAEMPPSV